MNFISIDTVRTGKQIEQARKAAGLSVHELQAILGLSAPNAIYRWERGQSLPTLDHLIILSDVFQVKIDDLIIRNKLGAF